MLLTTSMSITNKLIKRYTYDLLFRLNSSKPSNEVMVIATKNALFPMRERDMMSAMTIITMPIRTNAFLLSMKSNQYLRISRLELLPCLNLLLAIR